MDDGEMRTLRVQGRDDAGNAFDVGARGATGMIAPGGRRVDGPKGGRR
jgi:hypothetical protein